MSVLRQSGEVFNANSGAGMLTANHSLVTEALESLSEPALQAGTRASLKQEVRAALQQRVDLWMQRKQSLRGGAQLGYQRGNDGQTLALLQQPSVAGWTEFTVLNSLRDVEPGVELIFDDSGMDQAGGTS